MRYPLLAIATLACCATAGAIPNAVGGFIVQTESPLNGEDLTEVLLADSVWTGGAPLPGKWRAEAPVADVQSGYLLARPKIFGIEALLVQATHRDSRLDSLVFTFADAGSYFGYYRPDFPESLSKSAREERVRRDLADRQQAFQEFYDQTETAVREELARRATGRPRSGPLGKTRTLRTEVTGYRLGSLNLRMLSGGNRLVRVVATRADTHPRTWLDAGRAGMSSRSLAALYEGQVESNSHGDNWIEVPAIPQGYKPYCGLNTLAMAARYFGLHLDEDQLAIAGKFQNTGSADGSQMPRLYLAVAKEAGLDMTKSTEFDPHAARSCLRNGLPVIVWRRFSAERDRAHTRRTKEFTRDPAGTPPDAGDPDSWPGDDAPLHASVVVGHNDTRREFLLQESWSALQSPRRVHADELEATAYLTFYFKP